MRCLDRFKRRVNIMGSTEQERIKNEAIEDFNRYLEEAGTTYNIQLTDKEEPFISSETKWVKCTINDYAYNDRRFLDEKVLCVPNETNVEIGCYFNWQNKTWMLIFQEHNAIQSHKSFIARPCDTFISVYVGSKKVDLPAILGNLTLYSHGLSFDRYQTRENGKRSLMIGLNSVTKKFLIGKRIMINKNSTFMITHIDDFSFIGMATFTLLQTPKYIRDEVDDNIAFNSTEKYLQEKISNGIIEGSVELCIGTTNNYTININKKIKWELISESKKHIDLITNELTNSCSIKAHSKSTIIGQVIILQAKDGENNIIAELPIEITTL